jgi:hypothetical protein
LSNSKTHDESTGENLAVTSLGSDEDDYANNPDYAELASSPQTTWGNKLAFSSPSVIFSSVADVPSLSQAMNAISAPPTLPICTIAVMLPVLLASSTAFWVFVTFRLYSTGYQQTHDNG